MNCYKNVRGKTARVTIGRHGVFTPEPARKEAQEILYRIRIGASPKKRPGIPRLFRAVYNHAKVLDEEPPPNPAERLSRTRAWYRIPRRRSVIRPPDLLAWYQAVLALANETLRD